MCYNDISPPFLSPTPSSPTDATFSAGVPSAFMTLLSTLHAQVGNSPVHHIQKTALTEHFLILWLTHVFLVMLLEPRYCCFQP